MVEAQGIEQQVDMYLFQKVADNLPVGIFRLDVNGKIIFSNSVLTKNFGYSDWDDMKNNINEISGFPGFFSKSKILEQLESKGELKGFETSIKLKDGSVIYLRENIKAFRDSDGKIAYYDCTAENISDKIQEAENYRKLIQAVEQSPVSIIVTDMDGRIEYVNPKTCHVTGYTFRELYRSKPNILKSGETDMKEYQRLWKTITSGNVWRGVFHNKKKNGELYWESATIAPVLNSNGVVTHFVAVKEDITEKKGYEELLVKSELKYRLLADELKQLNATKDKLFSVIAHDLRGPIGSFRSVLDVLSENSEQDTSLREMILNELRKESDIIYEILDNLLYWSKVQQDSIVVNPVSIDVSGLLLDVKSYYLPRIVSKQLSINESIDGDLKIYGDREQLDLVLRNLMSNAVKFTPKGGIIKISTHKASDSVEICFDDSGTGMTGETLRNLFIQNDFFRTYGTEGEKGRGLGLMLCRYFTELNKGTISVSSTEGSGSQFILTFPLIS